MFKKLLPTFLSLVSFCAFALDQESVSKLLSTSGLALEVHGVVPGDGIYVVTHRNPENFFDSTQISVLLEDAALKAEFSKLNRHDKVLLWGKIFETPSPQMHIQVTKFELVKKYEGHPGEFEYTKDFPEELRSKSQAEFLVHSVAANGAILVLEYKDHIVPMFVRANQMELTKNLNRNDLLRIQYKIQVHPGEPMHIKLATDVESPLVVLQSVLQMHNQPADVEGELIRFPKSPSIKFNVYAILEKLPYGLNRQYTLINFDNAEEFAKMRERLDAAWDADPTNFVNARNKLVHKKLRVRAKGVFNMVDANQANVQILVGPNTDLEIKN